MRRELEDYRIELLEKALTVLGYRGGRHVGSPSEDYVYRKGNLHIILKEKRNRIIFHIHRDSPHHLYPARKAGTDIEDEFKRIVRTYKNEARRRAISL